MHERRRRSHSTRRILEDRIAGSFIIAHDFIGCDDREDHWHVGVFGADVTQRLDQPLGDGLRPGRHCEEGDH